MLSVDLFEIVILLTIVNIFLSCLVGDAGEKREIGYWSSFLLSFLFSPVIGLLFVLVSKEIETNNINEIGKTFTNEVKEIKNPIINVEPLPIGSILFWLIFVTLLLSFGL